MTQAPPPSPSTSIVARLAIVTLFVVLLLAALVEVVTGLQWACTLARALVSDASYVLANTLARILHDADAPHITRQHHGRGIPDLHPIDYLVLILWGSLFIMIVAYLVYLECAQYWARVWDDRAGSVPQGRQVRRHTDHAVSSAAPASADGG